MSLTEPTARPAATGGGETPVGSPRPWSYLRSMNGGQTDDARDWADDDRLDELFSAWARAAVATDDTPAGFAADAGEQARPVPPQAIEERPTAPTLPAQPDVEPFAWPTLGPDDDFGIAATGAATVDSDTPWAPVTAWTRTDDDIIPKHRKSRWGRRSRRS